METPIDGNVENDVEDMTAMTNATLLWTKDRLSSRSPIRPLVAGVLLAVSLAACSSPTPTAPPKHQVSAQSTDTLVRMGDHLRGQGQVTTALAMYQRAAAQSQDAAVLIRLGRTLAELPAYDQAAVAFRRALSHEPGHPEALLGLGTSYLALGEVDKSIQTLQQLIELDDDADPAPYAALGAALDVAGRHEQAVATYAQGLDLFPESLHLRSNLALSYALYDRHVEAIELMIRVVDALEADRSHHRNLVLIYALAGQDRTAVTAGRRFLGDTETRDVLAQAESLRQLQTGADRARALGLG